MGFGALLMRIMLTPENLPGAHTQFPSRVSLETIPGLGIAGRLVGQQPGLQAHMTQTSISFIGVLETPGRTGMVMFGWAIISTQIQHSR